MAEEYIKRYTPPQILNHWVHGISFVLLLLTGLPLFIPAFFPMTSIFGGGMTSRAIHHWSGVTFSVSLFILFLQFFRDNTFQPEDGMWLKELGGYLKKGPPIPSWKVNAGQKIAFWYYAIFGLVALVTGLVMWFPLNLPKGLVRVTYPVHDISSIGFVVFFLIHIYLSTIGNPGTFRGMITGKVTKVWTKYNHPLWAEDVEKKGG